MKPENYQQSINKWKTLKKDIEDGKFNEYSRNELRLYWLSKIWVSCGFCKEFGSKDYIDPCTKCPLHKKHCNHIIHYNTKNTVNSIYMYFTGKCFKKATMEIDKFIRAMSQFKNYTVSKENE